MAGVKNSYCSTTLYMAPLFTSVGRCGSFKFGRPLLKAVLSSVVDP
jgi:hypothetical protein